MIRRLRSHIPVLVAALGVADLSDIRQVIAIVVAALVGAVVAWFDLDGNGEVTAEEVRSRIARSPVAVAVVAVAMTLLVSACGSTSQVVAVDSPGIAAAVVAPGVSAQVQCGDRYGGEGPCTASGAAELDVAVVAGVTSCLRLGSPMLRIAGAVLAESTDGVTVEIKGADEAWLCMPLDVGASLSADSAGELDVSVCVESALGDQCAEWESSER